MFNNYYFFCCFLFVLFVVKSNLFGFMFLLVMVTVLGSIVIGLTPGSVLRADFGF